MSNYTTGASRQVEEGLNTHATPYQALKTAELNVQFALDPSFGLTRKKYAWYSNDTLFDDTFFSDGVGSINIETSATSGDVARLRSAYPGQYVAHTLAEPGLSLIIPSAHIERDENNHTSLTHGEITAGLLEVDAASDSGVNTIAMSFESDATYIQVRRSDTDVVKVPQKDWNIDPLDGSGPSGRVFKPENGYVYNFPYTWYNQGAIVFAIYDAEIDKFIPFHHAHIDGGATTGTANMPMEVAIQNLNTAEPLEARVGSMQFSTYGGNEQQKNKRRTDESRQTTNTYLDTQAVLSANAVDPFAEPGLPLVSVRRDLDSLRSRTALAVELEKIFINVDQDIWLFVFDEYNDTSALTGQNFTTPQSVENSLESQLETDTEATDYTPSAQSTLRSIQYVSTQNKEVRDITAGGNPRLPIDATIVVTAALAIGANNTDAEPFFISMTESY